MFLKKLMTCLVLGLAVEMGHAAVTVGTCQSSRVAYATISDAIKAAPRGGVVNVCPGTYAEQLVINKPLTIEGVAVAGQPGVTIVAPATGLAELPAGSQMFPQVYANAREAVILTNLSIDGAGATVLFQGSPVEASDACASQILVDYPGIYFVNTPGLVSSVNVVNHLAQQGAGAPPGATVPNCGSGIDFANSGHEVAEVVESVVNGYGRYGIESTGKLVADHNIILGGLGALQTGIQANGGGSITHNTINGTYDTVAKGIVGGDQVDDNVVQSFYFGVENAQEARNNTLVNNYVSVTGGTTVMNNMISTIPSYPDPRCVNNPFGCFYPPVPTVGVDLGCKAPEQVQNNNVMGAGTGVANVKAGRRVPQTNVFVGVGAGSTSCAQ